MKQFKKTRLQFLGVLLCLSSVTQAQAQSSAYSCNFSYRDPNNTAVGRVGVFIQVQPSKDDKVLVQEKTIESFKALIHTAQGKITLVSIQDLNTEMIASSKENAVSMSDPKTGISSSLNCGQSSLRLPGGL